MKVRLTLHRFTVSFVSHPLLFLLAAYHTAPLVSCKKLSCLGTLFSIAQWIDIHCSCLHHILDLFLLAYDLS
jgi:hypothetical protein